MSRRDQPIRMLRYWMEDKGIDACFSEYYPYLAKTDPVIHAALTSMEVAKINLENRVKQLMGEVPDEDE